MEKKALIAAVCAALAGGVLLELYLRRFESEVCGGDRIQVLVVAEDCGVGDVLAASKLSVRDIPEAYVESRHVRASERDRVVGTRLALAQRAGDALLWTDIAGMSTRRRTLSTLVRQGARAFTVRSQGGAFAGLLEPGDRVDVLIPKVAGDGHTIDGATPLIENVVVLAVGQRLEIREGSEDHAADGYNETQVTLSVTVEQGRALAGAERNRPLHLMLRNPDDILTHSAPVQPTHDRGVDR